MKKMKAEMNDMVYQEVHAMTKGDKKRQEKLNEAPRSGQRDSDRATAARRNDSFHSSKGETKPVVERMRFTRPPRRLA